MTSSIMNKFCNSKISDLSTDEKISFVFGSLTLLVLLVGMLVFVFRLSGFGYPIEIVGYEDHIKSIVAECSRVNK